MSKSSTEQKQGKIIVDLLGEHIETKQDDKHKMYQDYLDKLDNEDITLKDIPENIKTDDFLINCLEGYIIDLEDIPKDRLTSKICLSGLNHWMFASDINAIPDKFKNKSFWLKFACLNPSTIDSAVDKKYLNKEFYMEVLNNSDKCDCLKYIPQEYVTYDDCLKNVKKNWKIFTFVPDKYKDTNMYVNVLMKNSKYIKNVPKDAQTSEFWQLIIKKRGKMIKYLDKIDGKIFSSIGKKKKLAIKI
jgi:hypothetical protein